MNILVVTPFDSSNYGAFLQAYCLKRKLESMGHTVAHRLTRDADYVRHLYYHETPETDAEREDPLFAEKVEFGKATYRLFLEDQKVFSVVDPAAWPADLYLLGSDEVWNFKQKAFRQPLFWGEGMEPVISYAVSMGSADPALFGEYPELKNAMQSVQTLLVRDGRTKEFAESQTGRHAELVCDPTLLVPVESYGREYHDPFVEQNDCLLIYSYKIAPELQKSIREYAHARGLKTVGCCFVNDWCDHTCVCSPLEFSSLIRQSREVFTTTFHGSIFCILNHAKFVSVPVSPKTSQLLEQLSMTDRLLPKTPPAAAKQIAEVMARPIEYDEVDQRVAALRASSERLLQEAIASCTK